MSLNLIIQALPLFYEPIFMGHTIPWQIWEEKICHWNYNLPTTAPTYLPTAEAQYLLKKIIDDFINNTTFSRF